MSVFGRKSKSLMRNAVASKRAAPKTRSRTSPTQKQRQSVGDNRMANTAKRGAAKSGARRGGAAKIGMARAGARRAAASKQRRY